MSVKFWPLMIGFVLWAVTMTPASAFEKWSGPGYYLIEDYYLVSGPYSKDADCEAAFAAVPAQEQYDTNAACQYFDTDPDADDNN